MVSMSWAGKPFSVTFRGVRGSIPAPGLRTVRYGGNTSCVEVRADDQILILDAGTGIRALGHDLIAEFESRPIDATLLISHTHWDHIQGVPFFAPAAASQNRICIMAAKGAGPMVARALHHQMDPISFPIGLGQLHGLTEVEELSSEVTALGVFAVRAASLNHPGGCAGFRIEAKGASLAYLPDHEPFRSDGSIEVNRLPNSDSDALVEFVRGVNLLILDTQYTEEEYLQHRGWGHGCLNDSVSLALQAGVRQLALFHHDPGHSDDQIDGMIQTARDLAGQTSLVVTGARENETSTLSSIGIPLFRAPLPNQPANAAASLVEAKVDAAFSRV